MNYIKNTHCLYVLQKTLTMITALLLLLASCSQEKPKNNTKEQPLTEKKTTTKKQATPEPLQFRDIPGKWRLKYSNNYGYDFWFYKNYKSIVILYLNNQAIIFKGVYTIEGTNTIRINIVEMKHERTPFRINFYRGFVKAKSSYFLFNGELNNNGKNLVIRPIRTMIDGNNSGGYFEPHIKLKRL